MTSSIKYIIYYYIYNFVSEYSLKILKKEVIIMCNAELLNQNFLKVFIVQLEDLNSNNLEGLIDWICQIERICK